MENSPRMEHSHFPQLEKYEIIDIIGEGGMGYVFLARHRKIERLVAIKMLHEKLVIKPLLRERFKREAALLAKLQHKNIVILYDYEEQPNGLFLIMEFVQGKMMSEILKKEGAIPVEKAKKYMLQILDAFSYAHNMGIVHRDIKPSNIMITKSDDVKILDFGIGKIVDEENKQDLTSTGIRLGTLMYMAPEQLEQGIASPQTDIYSLGLTFFQMLTAEYPYPKNTYTDFQLSMKIVGEEFPPEGHPYNYIPEPLFKVLKKAVAKKPEERFSSCEEFRYELQTAFAQIEETPTTQTIIDEVSFDDLVLSNTQEKQAEDLLSTIQIPLPEEETTEQKIQTSQKKKSPVFFLVMTGALLVVIAVSAMIIYSYLPGEESQTSEEQTENPTQIPESVEPLVVVIPQETEDFPGEQEPETNEENVSPLSHNYKPKKKPQKQTDVSNEEPEVNETLSKIEQKLEYSKFSQFLQIDYENLKNFFGKYTSSDIKVTNYAPVKYKDIMFSVEFYDRDEALLNKKTFSFIDEVPAGGARKYKVKYKAPPKTADIRIKIIRAKPVY